jgi:autotransporter-associated beta strand protein
LGTSSATLSNLNGAGITYDLGALMGGPNTVLAGRATNNITTNATSIYRIGANGFSTVFSGRIADGVTNGLPATPSTVSVVKVGSGALLLNGINTFTGGTIVSNGVLGGNGSLASALTVTLGGTLSPGASTGTFTVSNNATLGGTVLMELNRASSPINDLLVVSGTITATGALVVTNTGPDLYNHSTFKLFSKPVTGFSSITLPTTDPSNTKTYLWTTNLSVDGSITLDSGGAINPNPTNIVANVTNGTVTLSWPADHTGWRLQAETNALSAGLNGNTWADVAGSTNVNTVAVPVDANNDSVFYRLILP